MTAAAHQAYGGSYVRCDALHACRAYFYPRLTEEQQVAMAQEVGEGEGRNKKTPKKTSEKKENKKKKRRKKKGKKAKGKKAKGKRKHGRW